MRKINYDGDETQDMIYELLDEVWKIVMMDGEAISYGVLSWPPTTSSPNTSRLLQKHSSTLHLTAFYCSNVLPRSIHSLFNLEMQDALLMPNVKCEEMGEVGRYVHT